MSMLAHCHNILAFAVVDLVALNLLITVSLEPKSTRGAIVAPLVNLIFLYFKQCFLINKEAV